MVANDRGTECCCCWIVVNLWVVVSRCGWLCVVVAGFGSLWGRCGSFHVLVTTMYVSYTVMCVFV